MQKSLVGTYKLVKYGYDYKNEKRFEPISDFYSGLIHYAESGFMNVIVRFAKEPKELEEVVSYSGSYKVEGNKIIHQVDMSVRPSYEGQTLIRTFQLDGLELITEFENTDDFVKFARWKKV